MSADYNPNPTSTASQTKKILAYLREGNTITPAEARRLFACDRLSGRIMDIEKIVGYKPPRKFVEVYGFDAEGKPAKKRVMQYWLQEKS